MGPPTAAKTAGGMRHERLLQPVFAGRAVFLDDGNQLTAGGLDSAGAQGGHALLRLRQHAHPGEACRDLGGIRPLFRKDDQDFGIQPANVVCERLEARVQERRADLRGHHDRNAWHGQCGSG